MTLGSWFEFLSVEKKGFTDLPVKWLHISVTVSDASKDRKYSFWQSLQTSL